MCLRSWGLSGGAQGCSKSRVSSWHRELPGDLRRLSGGDQVALRAPGAPRHFHV